MQVNTVIGNTFEWQIIVHTQPSQYQEWGAYYTCCRLQNGRGETIRLVSHYSFDEQQAANTHEYLCTAAKNLFQENL